MAKTKRGDLPADLLDVVMAEIYSVKGNDRHVVLVTSAFIEVIADAVIEAKCKNHKKIIKENRDFPLATKLLILHEMNLIDDELFAQLNQLRNIRNSAAHDVIFTVNKDDMAETFKAYRDPKHFFDLCTTLISILWNAHADILIPRFKAELARK